jgi:hypothetical protein
MWHQFKANYFFGQAGWARWVESLTPVPCNFFFWQHTAHIAIFKSLGFFHSINWANTSHARVLTDIKESKCPILPMSSNSFI